jgi:formate/nitrite transporter FocA (FNT family)
MPTIKRDGTEVAEPSPVITKRIEQEKVEERVAIGAHIVHEITRREGEEELSRSSSALAWSGLAAGLSRGFWLVREGLLAGYLPERTWTLLISKMGYSLGFLIVILERQQLYTMTTLTAMLPPLAYRNATTLIRVLRLWAVVLVANLWCGCFPARKLARLASSSSSVPT